ncbi:uncharacterized protein [Clytia hemisphaerica]|uniref:Uncharacterized protein n=1 Tax=Clytia hemisphaerica TaxID=252671 RepID=A0A7M5XCL2_9CNID
MTDSVIVYKHSRCGSSEDFVEVSRLLATEAINVTSTIDWNVWTSNSFISEHKECDCVVYKFSKAPPVISVGNPTTNHSVSKEITSKKHEKIFWCMSSTNVYKQDNSSASFLIPTTPSDNSRHKTQLTLNDSQEVWVNTWKKLCHSLQNEELNSCNAYYKEGKEIMIYHSGHQQAQVGQWIWDHVTCDYSKRTSPVLK